MRSLKLFFAVGIGMFGHLRAEEHVNISASDIESKVKIIGKLGKPLGTVCKVTCQVLLAAKPGSKIIPCKFLDVDGKPLGKIVIIAINVPTSMESTVFKPDDKLTLLGYETGSFVGTPAAARKIEKVDASKLEWEFQTFFHAVSRAPEQETTSPPTK